MIRKIIKIDKELCNGCGSCASACHEGAIKIIEDKAYLVREDYCDGLGDCLPACPTGAISIEEREAPIFNKNFANYEKEERSSEYGFCNCFDGRVDRKEYMGTKAAHTNRDTLSKLMQWPCQIKLVPTTAPYFENADLLIAADCVAYAFADFHNRFMRNKITLIGCPKLDCQDYAEKLTEIISKNNIKSLKILRMEVPCCAGIENAAKSALKASGKFIPWQVVTISTDGKIIE